jgi:hypothetical protein
MIIANWLRRIVFPVASILFSVTPNAHGFFEPVGVKVTFCVLAATPEKYDNQLVTITARYESDGVEREGLSDSACKESGLELIFSRETKGRNKLQTPLRGGYPGTLDKTVVRTFTGIFHWRPQEHPPRSLQVRLVKDISVAPQAGRSPSVLSHEAAHAQSKLTP